MVKYTTEAVAELLHMNTSHVRAFAQAGALEVDKQGHVSQSAFEDFAARRAQAKADADAVLRAPADVWLNQRLDEVSGYHPGVDADLDLV